MSIRPLRDELINKIAAGEVIERPASVIKEALENAIDAGATRIAVRISGGGSQFMEVEDDGQGIPLEEIPLAFQRHATSKLSSEQDLQHILSMGFRGEALPSIAAVARVQVFSRSAGEAGVFYHIEGGQVLAYEGRETMPGTRIVVEDLFFNTPARKHFLKSPVSEGVFINELVGRYALARPDISLSFSSEGRLYFKTPGNGKLRDAIVAIYGHTMMEKLLSFTYTGQDVAISGYLSIPEFKKSNRKMQCFFVNRRPIRSPVLYRAVDQAYQGMLVSREFPVALVSIAINPEQVDVNVHPQKSEVRFRKDQDVFRVVYEVLKNRLQDYQVGVSGYKPSDFEAAASQDVAEAASSPMFSAGLPGFRRQNTFSQARPCAIESVGEIPAIIEGGPDIGIIGQYGEAYILAEIDHTLFIVDQHAAHERILYSRLLDQDRNRSRESQELMFPIVMQLSALQTDLLQEQGAFFSALGFDLDFLGHNTVVIRAVPAGIKGQEEATVMEMLEAPRPQDRDQWRRQALISMACKQAVKSGQSLNQAEMAKLMLDLLQTPDYKYCPHGRPTLIQISWQDMERMFKR